MIAYIGNGEGCYKCDICVNWIDVKTSDENGCILESRDGGGYCKSCDSDLCLGHMHKVSECEQFWAAIDAVAQDDRQLPSCPKCGSREIRATDAGTFCARCAAVIGKSIPLSPNVSRTERTCFPV
jgi:hypothetical protein